MLSKLSIKNFALIEDATISFDKGFSVLTGETGSGKSILLDALNLLLGKRADSDSIRSGAEKCVIEGVFDVSKYQLQAFFIDNDLDYEDATIIRREITSNGKSRAFVNDTPIVLSALKLLGETLLDIHSQNANLILESNWFYYDLIDGVSGLLKERKTFSEEFKILQELQQLLKAKIANKEKSQLDLSFKQFQYQELKAAELKIGEQQDLEEQLEILSNAELIKSNVVLATQLLFDGEGSVLENSGIVSQKLSALSQYRSDFKMLSERMSSVCIELKDIYSEIESISGKIEIDPDKLQKIDERLGLLFALIKKYAVKDVDGLIDKLNLLEKEIDDVVGGDEVIENLKLEIHQKTLYLKGLASEITIKRKQGALSLEKEILNDLFLMNMNNAQLKIDVSVSELNIFGGDTIQFNFNANKGGVLQSLQKVASGGELSRIMLSLKRVLSVRKKLPTILFDEIDTGVSGEVADKMAEIMLKMSSEMQVIAITHLPQIASKGNSQYKVYKTDVAETTISQIKLLNKNDRVLEIAQMLSGSKITDAAIQNAKTLLG